MFGVVVELAPKITSDFPAKSAAPLARLVPRNVRRVTLRLWGGSGDSVVLMQDYVYGKCH